MLPLLGIGLPYLVPFSVNLFPPYPISRPEILATSSSYLFYSYLKLSLIPATTPDDPTLWQAAVDPVVNVLHYLAAQRVRHTAVVIGAVPLQTVWQLGLQAKAVGRAVAFVAHYC